MKTIYKIINSECNLDFRQRTENRTIIVLCYIITSLNPFVDINLVYNISRFRVYNVLRVYTFIKFQYCHYNILILSTITNINKSLSRLDYI